MDSPNTIYVTTREEWRKWLQKNHDSSKVIWLILFKKHTGEPTIPYEDAVEEALCFGWIDSKVKTVDDKRYMQKYTPRKDNSIWSAINKQRAQKLIREGRMTTAGLEKIEEAKINGKWSDPYTAKKKLPIPTELKEALMKNEMAWQNFNRFANSYRDLYIGWIADAKRSDTRKRRIEEVVKRSELNQKPGMK
ncbi:YdeI/OmpD-associated family protein [Methanolobus sp. ZRKC3]|uniref:YdeI/OmpD-associated family protein n=1 Tax=Methanolobus sp. ZRKC3 TaxID=3125786 RepID=UPI0032533BE7